ncbi:MAG TPA: hypothetical protein VEP90_02715, partial [Methylomirabilota bacterium]|nr:hypothetical protein [Methylomirabilota bacterium]
MNDFISTIQSSMGVGQRATLYKFLDDAMNGRVTASPESIAAALEVIGSLLVLPNADLTDPDGYNTTLATIKANLAGLMQEVDLLEATQSAMEDLNTSELDKTELALQDLQTMLTATRNANAANVQYTDVFFETFGAQVNRETDSSWYKPIPILAVSGQINSYLPLFIDPDDRTLKLFPGGDFSRTTNVKGDRLAHVEIEEILGLSSDPNHPITQAVDGNFFTYWGETILSDQPIDADPLQVPWLPDRYAGGTAARIHFRFPFAVPFTELVIKPFSKFPLHALQVVWDNRQIASNNFITDKFFTSGTTFWTTGGTTANAISFIGAGGFDNVSYVNIQAVSGRTTLKSNTFMVSGSDFAFHLVFRIDRQPTIKPQVLVQWFDLSSNLVRADWHTPDTPANEWFEADKLFTAPSGITSGWTGNVTFVTDGSGTCQLTRASFSVLPIQTNSIQLDQKQDLGSDTIILALDNAAGTDVWLVVAQPHYEFLQLTIPQGELDKHDIWNDVRLQVDSAAANVIGTPTTLYSYKLGKKTLPPSPLKEDGSTLLKEVMRLGGRVRDMVVNLMRFATPDPTPITLNKYLYILGAWEIQIRHREYAPAGLFVSKPYQPRGEVRQLLMITDPPISALDRRIRFWITARADDRTDKAQIFTGRCTFSSSTETVSKKADTHFTLAPVTIREVFEGADREHRVALTNHPYADRDRIWLIQNRLTSGFISTPIVYDPNKDPVFFLSSTGVASIPGYRPIRVTLQFTNGTIARPDLLGKIHPGDISLQSAEILSPATISQEFSFLNQSTQKDIEAKVGAAVPSDRQDLRAKLVQSALTAQQLGGGQNTSKRTQTVQLTALQTKFKRIVSGINGAALSLYWHKGGDIVVTSGDVLISPSKYSVDAQNGVIIVRDSPPNGNPQYNQFVAYYYYQQDEIGARVSQDSRSIATRPVSGVDFLGSLPQTSLVTRNVTDYVRGVVSSMRKSNVDDLDPDFY